MFQEEVICTIPVLKDGIPAECGTTRHLNAHCPNEQNHVSQQCPTCGSSAPAAHPGVQVCHNPWHSSTHAGREMMNKLVGHAWYDQAPQALRDIVNEVKSMEYPEVSGGGVPYPGPYEKSGGVPDTARGPSGREGPLQPGSRAVRSMPGVPSVSGPASISQVLLRDVQYAIHALARLKYSLEAFEVYQRKLVELAAREAADASSSGKVPASDFPNDLDKQHQPVFYHDERGRCINHQPGELVGCLDDQMYLTPGGTVHVEHGEHGDDEMPGMWSAADMSGGNESGVVRRRPDPTAPDRIQTKDGRKERRADDGKV